MYVAVWCVVDIGIIPKLCPPCPSLRLKVGGGVMSPWSYGGAAHGT